MFKKERKKKGGKEGIKEREKGRKINSFTIRESLVRVLKTLCTILSNPL